MLTGTKRRSPTWQLAMLLIVFGAVLGYSCCANLNIWGGRPSSWLDTLYPSGALIGIVAVISGCGIFLSAAGAALATTPGSNPYVHPSSASSGAATPQLQRESVAHRQASVPRGAAITCLHIVLLAAVALAVYAVFRDWGRPSLASSYGRSYWLPIFLQLLLLNCLPYGIAVIRTWRAPDRAGFALAIAAGLTQFLIAIVPRPEYIAHTQAPWPWLTTGLGLATVILACVAWRPSFSRKGDVGLVISIFFGFLIYTELAAIAVLTFSHYMRTR
jgi:hypothetical protein